MVFYELYREANALVQESISARSAPFVNQPRYNESGMIELQDLSQPSTPSLSTHASTTETNLATHSNRNGKRVRVGNNSPNLFAAVGDWISTSAATLVSAAHDLAEDVDINIDIENTLESLSASAVRVVETSIEVGLAATSQSQSTIEGAIASYRKHSRRRRGTTVLATESCQGHACRGLCCSSAYLMTEEDIERAIEHIREEEVREYQMRRPSPAQFK